MKGDPEPRFHLGGFHLSLDRPRPSLQGSFIYVMLHSNDPHMPSPELSLFMYCYHRCHTPPHSMSRVSFSIWLSMGLVIDVISFVSCSYSICHRGSQTVGWKVLFIYVIVIPSLSCSSYAIGGQTVGIPHTFCCRYYPL